MMCSLAGRATEKGTRDNHADKRRIDSTGAKPKEEEFAVSFLTASTTRWGLAKQLIMESTDKSVIFLQEHRLLAHEIAEAKQGADNQGWRSTFAAALHGRGEKGASGGTAGLGFVEIGIPTGQPHRIAACTVEAPGTPKLIAAPTYSKDGMGATTTNIDVFNDVGEYIHQSGTPAPIGAGFNMEPASAIGTGPEGKLKTRCQSRQLRVTS